MRSIIFILSLLLCAGAVHSSSEINAWGLSLFGSLSPQPKPFSNPNDCASQAYIVDPTILFPNHNYQVTACGGKVYYWNATHMYGMGSNYGGSLGTGSFGATDTRCAGAQPISTFRNAGEEVEGVSCSSSTIIAWTKSGKVYGWGSNLNKQLGPIVTALALPTLLPMPVANVTKVVVGGSHVLALSESKEVICWGTNRWRQCGTVLADSIWPPVKLHFGLSPVADVAVGRDHSLVLQENGDVYGFGFNHYGQVCKRSNALRGQTPPVIDTSPIVGQAFYGRPVRAIAANGDGSFFLTDEGRLFGCGKSSGMGFAMYSPYVDRPREITVLPPDELGSTIALSKIIASQSAYHALGVTMDFQLVGAGSNTAGELALNVSILSTKPFVSLLNDSLDPVTHGSVAGYQSVVFTDSELTRPSSVTLAPQCEIQGCTCPLPLFDAICVDGKWTAPNAIIWVNTTIGVNVELVGDLTLAPGGSLSMPIGDTIDVRGCTNFYGGVINFTATPEQLIQLSQSPLLFINTTCGDGTPSILLTVQGEVDPCNNVTVKSIEQGPQGYYILFNHQTCKGKPLKLWIIGAVIGGIVGLVIITGLLVMFIRPLRVRIFPFFRRQEIEENAEESRAINAKYTSSADPATYQTV